MKEENTDLCKQPLCTTSVIDAIYVHIIILTLHVCEYTVYRKAFNYNNEIVDGC